MADDDITSESESEPTPPDAISSAEPDARPGRARRAAVAGLRLVRGAVGVGAAVVIILIVGFVPFPTIGAPNPTVTVTPVPANQLRVCDGALLQLGGASGSHAATPSALGAPTVHFGAVGGSATVTPLGKSDAGTGKTASAPQVATLAPAPGSALSGAQSQLAQTSGTVGFAADDCTEPSGSIWLVGGATTVGRTTLLLLSNPTGVDATVSLTVLAENGRIVAPGLSGVDVPAGTQRVIPLSGFAPDAASPVVHVVSRGGQVAAALQQTTTRVLDPGGVDLVGAAADPATHLVIPGVRIRDAVGVGTALGRQDYQDLIPAIRVAVPGSKAAKVTVSVTPGDPKVQGTSFVLSIDAFSSSEVPLDSAIESDTGRVGLADGLYTVTVDADRPVVAATRISTATFGADRTAAPTTDFAWTTAAPLLTGDTLMTVAAGPSPMISVANPGTTPVTVTFQAQGGTDLKLTVPAGQTTSIAAVAGTSYLAKGVAGLHITVSFADVGQLAGYSIASPHPASEPIVIHP